MKNIDRFALQIVFDKLLDADTPKFEEIRKISKELVRVPIGNRNSTSADHAKAAEIREKLIPLLIHIWSREYLLQEEWDRPCGGIVNIDLRARHARQYS